MKNENESLGLLSFPRQSSESVSLRVSLMSLDFPVLLYSLMFGLVYGPAMKAESDT